MRYRPLLVSDWWMLHSLALLRMMPRPNTVGANSEIANAKVMALENYFLCERARLFAVKTFYEGSSGL